MMKKAFILAAMAAMVPAIAAADDLDQIYHCQGTTIYRFTHGDKTIKIDQLMRIRRGRYLFYHSDDDILLFRQHTATVESGRIVLNDGDFQHTFLRSTGQLLPDENWIKSVSKYTRVLRFDVRCVAIAKNHRRTRNQNWCGTGRHLRYHYAVIYGTYTQHQ